MKHALHSSKIGLLALILCVSGWAHAATYYSFKSSAPFTTNFSSLSNWTLNANGTGGNPGSITSADSYIIQDGYTVTVDANISVLGLTVGQGTSGALVIGNSTTARSITLAGSGFTVATNGSVTVGAFNATHTITSSGAFTVNGSMNLQNSISQIADVSLGGTFNLAGSGATCSFNNLTITSGTVSATRSITALGGLTVNSGSTFTPGAFTHTVYGNVSISGTYTASASNTLVLAGTLFQSISGGTYTNLTANGGGTVTVNTAFTVSNDMNINGGSTVSSGSSNITVNGALTVADGSTLTNTSNIFIFNGAAQAIDIGTANASFNSITFGGTNTKTLTGNLNVNGTLTVNSGVTLNSSGAHTLRGNVTQQGTANFSGSILFASSITPTLTGNASSILTLGTAPITFTGQAQIASNHSWNVSSSVTISSGYLIINSGSSLNDAQGTNTFTLASGARLYCRSAATTTFPNSFATVSLDQASTVYYDANLSQTVRGGAGVTYGALVLGGGSGNIKSASAGLNITGNLTLTNTITLALLNFSHTFSGNTIVNGTLNNGTITSTTGGTFTFAGADINQALNAAGSGSYTFHNVVITNPITPSAVRFRYFQHNVTLNGDLTISNPNGDAINRVVLDIQGNTLSKSVASGTLSLGSNSGIYATGTSTIGTAFSSFTTLTLDPLSIVRFYGTTQNIPAGTYGTLEISGNGTKTVLGSMNILGDMFRTGGNAQLALGTFSHTVAGDWNVNSTTLVTPGTSTVTFNGVDQDVFASPLNNVVFANTGTATLQGTITASGNVTVNNGATVAGNVRSITLSGNFTVGTTGVFTQTTGGLTFSGSSATAQTITLNAASNLGSVTLSRLNSSTSKTVQALSNITVLNNFVWSVAAASNSNVFDLNGFTLKVAGAWTYQGTNSSFLPNNGTVEYNSSLSTQSIANIKTGISYVNILFSGNGPKQINNSTIAVTGDFTINSGVQVTTSQSITLSGNWVNSGTFNQTGGTVTFSGTAKTISASTFQGVTVTGSYTLAGAIIISGNLAINAGATLDVSASNYSIDVDNNITVNATGILTCRNGLVTVNNVSTVAMNGTGTGHQFYDLEIASGTSIVTITGSLKVLRNLTTTSGTMLLNATALNVGGSLTNNAAMTFTTGILTFDGSTGTNSFFPGVSTFGPIVVNASGATYQLTGALTCSTAQTFTLTAGTFALNGNTMTMAANATINGGTFDINSGATLRMLTGTTLSNTAGILRLVGNSTSLATVTINGTGNYTFNNSGGTIHAKFYSISNTGANGLTISGSSVIDATNNLSNGTFSSGLAGATNTYLTLTGLNLGAGITATNVTFNTGPGYNIVRTSGTGVMTFQDALGPLAGNGFRSPTTTSSFAIFALPAGAVTWDNGSGDNQWSTAANWSNNIVPTASTLVYLDHTNVSGIYTVNITGGNAAVAARVTLDAGGANAISLVLNNGTLAVSGTMTIGASTTLTQTGAADAISVKENWFNTGTFNEGTSTVTFNGNSGTQTISTLGTGDPFYNLVFNASGANYALGSTLKASNNFTLTNGTVDVGTNDFYCSGSWSRSLGTFTPRIATIYFDGTGAQSITGGTFYNLNTTSSVAGSIKTLTGSTTVSGNVTIGTNTILNGSSNTLTVSGNWINNVGNTGFTQTTTGSVFFSGGNQTIGSGGSATTFQNVYLSGAGTKVFANTSTINGDFSMLNTVTQVDINSGVTVTGTGSGTFTQLGGILRILGTAFPASFGNYTLSAGTVNYFANGAQTLQAASYVNLTLTSNGSATTKTANGNVSVSGIFSIADANTTLDMNSNTLTLNGTYTHFAGAPQVTYGASGTLVHGGAAFTFPVAVTTLNNVLLSGSGNKTLSSNLTINGNLTLNSGVTMIMGTNTITGASTKTFTMNDGATTTCAIISGTALPSSFTNYNFASTSTYRLNGTADQTISSLPAYGALDISTAGGTATFNGATTVNGNFTMTGGAPTFADGGFSHTFNGNINFRNYTPTAATTITFSGANQTILNSTAGFPAISFANVVFGGSGTKTISSNDIALSGTLTINSGVTVTTVNDVTVSGSGSSAFVNNGTYTQTAGITYLDGTSSQTMNPGTNSIRGIYFSGSAKTISTNGLNIGIGTFTFDDAFTLNMGTLSHTIGSASINFLQPTPTISNWQVTTSNLTFNGAAQSIPAITVANITLSGTGTKTLLGNITFNDLSIASGVTLDVDASNNYQVTCRGNFINSGTFLPRTGLVRFDNNAAGTRTITSPTFYNVSFNPSNLSPSVSTFNLGSSTTCQSSVTIGNNATVVLNGYNMTVGSASIAASVAVNSGGILTVSPISQLLFNNTFDNSSTIVSSGGRLNVVGNASDIATVARSSGTFKNRIRIMGTIAARYYLFNNLADTGMHINGTATVDNTSNFSDGTFSGINTAGTGGPYRYMSLNAFTTPSTSINNVTFNHGTTPVVGQHFNVLRTTTNGNATVPSVITFAGTISGLLAGSTYESDASNYITWPNITTATWTGASNTDWFTAGNWSPAAVPTATANVIIPSTTNSPSITTTGAVCRDLTITNGVLSITGGNNLTVSGSATIGTGTSTGTLLVQSSASTISVDGNWLRGTNGVFTPNGSTVNFTANAGGVSITPLSSAFGNVTLSGSATYTWNGTTTTINGNLTQINGTLTIVPSIGNYTLNIGGNYNRSGGVFTRTNTGTVVLTGTTQSITGGTFSNLTVSGSGTKTATNAMDITGVLVVNSPSTLAMASGAAMTVAGNVTINSGATFNGGNSNHTFGGGTWTGTGSYTGSGSTVTFSRNSNLVTTTITAGSSFESLVLSGLAATNINGAVNMTGDLTLSAGINTVNVFTNLITNTLGTGTFTIGAAVTFNLTGSNNFPVGFSTYALDATSNTNYSGTINQTIAAATYGNLNISNANTKTLAGNIIVSGNLNFNTATLDVSSNNYKINIAGNFNNNSTGSFTANLGQVVFDGSGAQAVNLTNTGTKSFYDIQVNKSAGTLSMGGVNPVILNNLQVNSGTFTNNGLTTFIGGDLIATSTGILANSGTFNMNATSGSTGTIQMNGSAVSSMVIAPIAGYVYYANDALTINGSLTVSSGIFDGNGQIITVGSGSNSLLVSSGAKYRMSAGGTLKLGNATTVTVSSGGTFEAVGTTGAPVLITRRASGNTSSFNINGIIGARYYQFEYLTATGVSLSSTASINTTNNFSDGTFTLGTVGGTFLRIENTQSFTTAAGTAINNVKFISNPGSGSFNVTKSTAVSGVLEFYNSTGVFSSATYENDATGLINWTGPITLTWNGAVSNDWFTASNWSASSGPAIVPTSATDVVIASGTNNPTITGANAICASLVINSGTVLSVTSSTSINTDLDINGNLTLNGFLISSSSNDLIQVRGNWLRNATGTFTPGAGTLVFNTVGIKTLDNGTTSFNNLTISGSSIVQLAANTIVSNTLTIASGATLDVSTSNFNLTVGGSIANSGTLTTGTSTLTLNATTGSPTINAGSSSIYNLAINPSPGITYSLNTNKLTVLNNLDLTTGTLSLNGLSLEMGNNITSPTLTVSSTLLANANSFVKLGSNAVVNVNSGGRFSLVGTSVSAIATLTQLNSSSTAYSFNVNTGGTLAAQFYIMEYMNATGIWLKSGSTLDATNTLQNGSFSNGTSGGQFILFDNAFGSDRTISNVAFNTGPLYGPRRTTGTNNVIFSDATGSLGQYLFEKDDAAVSSTAGKIRWSYTSTTVTWTGATNTSWATASNWNPNTVPTSSINVFIPVVSNMPTISANATTNNLTINSGATLTVSSNANLTVSGAFANSGTLTVSSGSASSLIFAGAYANSGTVSNSTTSTIELTASTGSQTITHTSGTIRNLKINSGSGSGNAIFSTSSSLTITGDVTITSGTLRVGQTTHAIALTGNWVQTGGTFTPNGGTVTLNGTGVGTQTISQVSGSSFFNLTTSGSMTKSLSSDITVDNNLTISTGSNLTANARNINITKDFIVSGTGAFTAGTGTLTFNGTTGQNLTPGSASLVLNNIVLNNSSVSYPQLSLNGPVTVQNGGALTLTSGKIYTTSVNLITFNSTATVSGGSSSSYVAGPVRKVGTADFTFPVGTSSFRARLGINNIASSATFTAQYFASRNSNSLTSVTGGLSRISSLEYWDLSRTTGTATPFVTLFWENGTRSSVGTTLTNLRVAHWTGSAWENLGGTTSGTTSSGSITSTIASASYSPFTLGSTSLTDNPLPVTFMYFNGRTTTEGVVLDWATATEINSKFFTVQRSTDGKNWEKLGYVSAARNSNSVLKYNYLDKTTLQGRVYYRLLQTDVDGQTQSSPTIAVIRGEKSIKLAVSVYPNPTTSREVHVNIDGITSETVATATLMNINGQVIESKEIAGSDNGTVTSTLNLMSNLPAGVYMLSIQNGNEVVKSKIVLQ